MTPMDKIRRFVRRATRVERIRRIETAFTNKYIYMINGIHVSKLGSRSRFFLQNEIITRVRRIHNRIRSFGIATGLFGKAKWGVRKNTKKTKKKHNRIATSACRLQRTDLQPLKRRRECAMTARRVTTTQRPSGASDGGERARRGSGIAQQSSPSSSSDHPVAQYTLFLFRVRLGASLRRVCRPKSIPTSCSRHVKTTKINKKTHTISVDRERVVVSFAIRFSAFFFLPAMRSLYAGLAHRQLIVVSRWHDNYYFSLDRFSSSFFGVCSLRATFHAHTLLSPAIVFTKSNDHVSSRRFPDPRPAADRRRSRRPVFGIAQRPETWVLVIFYFFVITRPNRCWMTARKII